MCIRDSHKTIYFQSKSGPLTTRITPNEEIVMDFPAQVTTSCEAPKKKEIEDVLGVKVKKCLFSYEDYLVELESSEVVVEFKPDFSRIEKIDCRGIIITSWDSHFGFDCVSRFFCPRVGIKEDQVCVSAHCKILPYWQQEKGKKILHAWQASQNGGELFSKSNLLN